MIRRYLRAFIGALRLTLRGQTVPPLTKRYPNLSAWWRGISERTNAVIAAADANGLPKSAREALVLRVEGRDMSMETILAAARYHAEQELPALMRREDDFSYLTLQAIVMNDRFLAQKLAQSAALPAPVKAAAADLAAHFEALPRKDAL